MEFKRENPAARFTVPDRPTVRQQLAYYSLASGNVEEDMILRLWTGAQALIQEWECDVMPKHDVELDGITDPSQTAIVLWVAFTARTHMNSLEDIPKNS